MSVVLARLKMRQAVQHNPIFRIEPACPSDASREQFRKALSHIVSAFYRLLWFQEWR